MSGHYDLLFQWLERRSARRATQGALPEAGVLELRRRASGAGRGRLAGRLSALRRAHPAERAHGADLARWGFGSIPSRRGGHMIDSPRPAPDLHDIQGNIVKAYSRLGFPKARYVFFRVREGGGGRAFVRNLIPLITSSAAWSPTGTAKSGSAVPQVAINLALTFDGLRHLGVPQASLQTFPA